MAEYRRNGRIRTMTRNPITDPVDRMYAEAFGADPIDGDPVDRMYAEAVCDGGPSHVECAHPVDPDAAHPFNLRPGSVSKCADCGRSLRYGSHS